MSDTYDIDILEWSRHQARLLRRLAAGERLNEQPDWSHIAEEIEEVARRETRECRSHLVQALAHRMKIQFWPNSLAVPHWKVEEANHRQQAIDAYVPSMRKDLDIDVIYTRAMALVPDEIDGQLRPGFSYFPPMTLDELLQEPKASGQVPAR